MEYDGEMLNIIPDGEPDDAQQHADELVDRIAVLDHELANSRLALVEAQRRLDMFAELLAGKEAELALANGRIAELNAQLTAIAEDAQHWVDRKEFDDQLKLTTDYGKEQWYRRHRGKPYQTFPEWLATLE